MDYEWSAEQELLRESVCRFVRERAPVERARALWDEPVGTTEEDWKGLVDLGVPGLLVPEEHGGAGQGVLEMGVVLEELGRVVHPGPVLSSALVATRLVAAVAEAARRDELLPRLAAGSARACVAFGDGSEGVTARRDGDVWRLDGALAPVLDAAACDTWLVPVPGTEDGSRVWTVERAGPGARATPFPAADGSRKLARVELEGAPARPLGEADAAVAVAEAHDLFDLGLVTDALGSAGRALELATAYAREREQFGRPIGSFQSIQHLLVDVLEAVELLRAATIHALWCADFAPPEARAHAVSVAKAAAAESLPGVGAAAIQVFGGLGFTWEMEVHLHDKRLCSQALLGRSEAWHLACLARAAVDGHAGDGPGEPGPVREEGSGGMERGGG